MTNNGYSNTKYDMGKEIVAAVVVTFNRKNLLEECLDAIIEQTFKPDAIIIIDNNSTDGTAELLLEKSYINNLPPVGLNNGRQQIQENLIATNKQDKFISIIYLHKSVNSGASGGFYEGLKLSYEKQYTWAWLMDDDVAPQKDCLEQLLNQYSDNNNISCIVPTRIYPNGDIVQGHELILSRKVFSKSLFKIPETERIEKMTFEGPLLKTKYFNVIKKDILKYFLLFDDNDAAYKISKRGIIVKSEKGIMIKKIQILNNFYTKGNEWKQYYRYRNKWIYVRNNFELWMLFPVIYEFLRELKILITDTSKWSYIKVFFRAVGHFLVGKEGKTYTKYKNPWTTNR